MGANQSGQQVEDLRQSLHGITVVNPNPEQSSPTHNIVLPARVLPILPLDGQTKDPDRHKEFQLNPQLWIEFVEVIREFANSRSDLIATRQSHLHEKVIVIDEHVQDFTNSYINEKHRALARLNDDCRRVEEVNKLLQKCTIQSELCVDMLNKLNFLLPQEHKLETLEP